MRRVSTDGEGVHAPERGAQGRVRRSSARTHPVSSCSQGARTGRRRPTGRHAPCTCTPYGSGARRRRAACRRSLPRVRVGLPGSAGDDRRARVEGPGAMRSSAIQGRTALGAGRGLQDPLVRQPVCPHDRAGRGAGLRLAIGESPRVPLAGRTSKLGRGKGEVGVTDRRRGRGGSPGRGPRAG
jgi:hypothetical protein